MNKKKKILPAILRYVILIVVFIGAFLLIRWFYANLTTSTYEAPLPAVETVNAEKQTLYKSIRISGYVQSEDTISIVPYVEGTIITFDYKEGDVVKKGDVIAKIDPEPYELQLEQATAAYNAYDSSYQRVEALYNKNAASKQDLDALKGQRDAYKAQMELAKLQLSYTDVTAKEGGTIQKKLLSKGSAASTSTPIALISDLNNLVVNVNVPEQYYDIFKDVDNLKVTVTRPENAYSKEVSTNAHISFVAPYIDPTSKNFQLQVELDGDDLSSFTPGMYVKVDIVYDEVSGYTLPSRVKKLDGSIYYVEDGKAVFKDMSSAFSDGSYFVIPDELADKAFIIKGQDSLLSGEEVNVIGGDEE